MMPVGFVRKAAWLRPLLTPQLGKSRFGNSSILFSPLSAKRSMPLSVTGCDGPQRKPGTFARGRPRIHKRNQSTRNDRRATDELRHFAAAGTEAFCRRAVRLRNLAGREGANGYRTISASRCGGRQRGDPRIFHRPQRGGLLGCPRRQRADRRNLSA
jgi:hypothetical protein